MAFQLATATKHVTQSARLALLAGGDVQLRSGAQPITAQGVATGLLLATIVLPSPAGSLSTVGVTVKLSIILPLSYVLESGTIGYARFRSRTGETVFDGECGIPGSGATIIVTPASGTPSLSVFTGGELTLGVAELSE